MYIERQVSSGCSKVITPKHIRTFFELDDSVGFTITHTSAQIIFNGQQIGETYPGDNIDILNTQLPPPCNCVHVKFDRSTQTIILSNC